jgi:hypothetical protein
MEDLSSGDIPVPNLLAFVLPKRVSMITQFLSLLLCLSWDYVSKELHTNLLGGGKKKSVIFWSDSF